MRFHQIPPVPDDPTEFGAWLLVKAEECDELLIAGRCELFLAIDG